LSVFSGQLKAFDFKKLSDEQLHTYDQKTLKYEDELGDAVLCQKGLNTPEILAEMKSKEFDYDRYPRPDYVKAAEAQLALMEKGEEDPQEVILGRDSPYNIKGFEKMFIEVLRQEAARGLKITKGVEHEWSRDLKRNDGGHCTIPFVFSKLLLALIMGQTALHMATGQEEVFLEWVLVQPEMSITPESAFRASLRINNGDVYLALLTIENLYSAAWTVRNREDLPWIKRVRVIVNAHKQFTRDNYGPWYHFWGMVLYSYLRTPAWSVFVANAENAGTLFIVKSDRRQKHHTNLAGAKIGSRLARVVKKELYKKASPNPQALVFENYLQQDEDFRDRIKVETDEVIGLELTSRTRSMGAPHRNPTRSISSYLTVWSLSRQVFKNCTVDMIPDRGSGLDARNLIQYKNVSFDSSRARKFTLSHNRKLKNVRVFIYGCQGQEDTQYIQEINSDPK